MSTIEELIGEIMELADALEPDTVTEERCFNLRGKCADLIDALRRGKK